MNEASPFKVYAEQDIQGASLVVGWTEDAGRLGSKVIDYLNGKLGGQELGELEPAGFFLLGGVSVEDDVARFPESKFYYCREKNLVTFKSAPPQAEWYAFLNSVLDVATRYCHVKEVYTVGGMVSVSAHTAPRGLLATASSPEMKRVLAGYDLARDVDYETPPGQRPTLNSFLLWVARRRNIAAAGLWVTVPFYLAAAVDPQACGKPLDFLDRRLGLGLDFMELDGEVELQNTRIAALRDRSPDIDGCISKLERNESLTADENEKLLREIEGAVNRRE